MPTFEQGIDAFYKKDYRTAFFIFQSLQDQSKKSDPAILINLLASARRAKLVNLIDHRLSQISFHASMPVELMSNIGWCYFDLNMEDRARYWAESALAKDRAFKNSALLMMEILLREQAVGEAARLYPHFRRMFRDDPAKCSLTFARLKFWSSKFQSAISCIERHKGSYGQYEQQFMDLLMACFVDSGQFSRANNLYREVSNGVAGLENLVPLLTVHYPLNLKLHISEQQASGLTTRAWCYLLIFSYLTFNQPLFKEALRHLVNRRSEFDVETPNLSQRFVSAYSSFISNIGFVQDPIISAKARAEEVRITRAVAFIGDSHVLSFHGYYRDNIFTKAWNIVGLTGWKCHANEDCREIHLLEHSFCQAVHLGFSDVVISIGEIDCRANQGIDRLKSRDGIGTVEAVELLTSSIIRTVRQIARRFPAICCHILSPIPDNPAKPNDEKKLYLSEFCSALSQKSKAAGFPLIDLQLSFLLEEDAYVDSVHLKRDFIVSRSLTPLLPAVD